MSGHSTGRQWGWGLVAVLVAFLLGTLAGAHRVRATVADRQAVARELATQLRAWRDTGRNPAGQDSLALARVVADQCLTPPTSWPDSAVARLCVAQAIRTFDLVADAQAP